MSYIIWPLSLPQSPLNSGYVYSRGSTVVRTSMDIGPAKVRRKQSRAIDVISVSYILDDAQVQTLDKFISESLHGGVMAFEFPDCKTGATRTVRVVAKGDEMYALSRSSDKYSVTLMLEVMP